MYENPLYGAIRSGIVFDADAVRFNRDEEFHLDLTFHNGICDMDTLANVWMKEVHCFSTTVLCWNDQFSVLVANLKVSFPDIEAGLRCWVPDGVINLKENCI